MAFSANTLASALGVGVKNVQFAPGSELVSRKVVVLGAYDDATYTDVTADEPVRVGSPEEAGAKFGFGGMIHRAVRALWRGSQGVECWVVPQVQTSAAATGTITVSGPATANGTLAIYIAGDRVPVVVTKADADTTIATAIAAAITADKNLPVTAAAVDEVVTLTAKNEGTWGNFITIRENLNFGDETPAGVSLAVVAMASGAGVPTIDDALTALGTGLQANKKYFTDGVNCYGADTTTLDDLQTYVGAGNDYLGCYAKLVGRPLYFACGDTTSGTSVPSALTTLGSNRKTLDRVNALIALPGSPNHPAEIAAQVVGLQARSANTRAEEDIGGQVLTEIYPATSAQWTDSIDERDTAIKAGIGYCAPADETTVEVVDFVTFYHPDDVPSDSNGYRYVRSISIIQNMLYNMRLNFSQVKWKGVSIVNDPAKVTAVKSREKARAVADVVDDLIALAKQFESRAWIFSAAFTIEKLVEGLISIRSGGSGFVGTFPVILSGNAKVFDLEIEFDTALTALGL